MDYKIEIGELTDLPSIARLNQEIFSGLSEREPYNLSVFKTRLAGRESFILLAKNDGELAGYSVAFAENQSWYLWVLGVKKEYQRQGIASALIAKNISRAQEQGYKSLTVKTTNSYPEMLRLLLKNDFHILKVEPSGQSSKYNQLYLEKTLD